MEFFFAALVLVGIVAWVVIGPLRRAETAERSHETRLAALEAAKEAKYREIRDAELDYRMGKLSEEDWKAADRELRQQAMAILRDLDTAEQQQDARDGGGAQGRDGAGADS